MSDVNRYETFVGELQSLESRIESYFEGTQALLKEKTTLEKEVAELQTEVTILRAQVRALEEELSQRPIEGSGTQLTLDALVLQNGSKEELKAKIQEFIKKLDSYLLT